MSRLERFILMPAQGVRVSDMPASATITGKKFFRSLRTGKKAKPYSLQGRPAAQLFVRDEIQKDGPKLVEISPQAYPALRKALPGFRLLPVCRYNLAVMPRPAVKPVAMPKGVRRHPVTVRVVSRDRNLPIAGAQVMAFTHFDKQIGAEARTDRRGEARLLLGKSRGKLERLYVYPQKNFWPYLTKKLKFNGALTILLTPLDLGTKDGLRHFYTHLPPGTGKGVKVAVIDTGIAKHSDLKIAGGENTVLGEEAKDFGDNGTGHGTHVAGIIAGRGKPPQGIIGLAPEASLHSFRVFGRGHDSADNYVIAKAIYQAVKARCDLINLSLGCQENDPAIQRAIEEARNKGCLVIAAAGNDGRQRVNFPACDADALAVSAFGRRGTFPGHTPQQESVKKPFGTDPNDFVASFSNIGPEIDFTAPGVGIISTWPGGHAVLDGTSMACPVITGMAARLLGNRPRILAKRRNKARAIIMASVLYSVARSMGFGLEYEGQGSIL